MIGQNLSIPAAGLTAQQIIIIIIIITSFIIYAMTHLCQKTTVLKPLSNELHDARGYSYRFHFVQVLLRLMQRPQSYFRDEEECRPADSFSSLYS